MTPSFPSIVTMSPGEVPSGGISSVINFDSLKNDGLFPDAGLKTTALRLFTKRAFVANILPPPAPATGNH